MTMQEWTPDKKTSARMAIIGNALTILALIGFGTLYALRNPDGASFVISVSGLWKVLVVIVLVMVGVVVHELLHGLALRTLGHKPKYGATMVGGVTPAFYCTSVGAKLSKTAFTYVALLPGILLLILPIVWILAGWPFAGWIIIPAGMLFGGAIGDVFMTLRALRAPRGAFIEDNKEGLRIWT